MLCRHAAVDFLARSQADLLRQEKVVKILLEAGADPNLPSSWDDQKRPIHLAAEMQEYAGKERVRGWGCHSHQKPSLFSLVAQGVDIQGLRTA